MKNNTKNTQKSILSELSLKRIHGGSGTCTFTKNGEPQGETDVKDKAECDKFQTDYNNAVKFIYSEDKAPEEKPEESK